MLRTNMTTAMIDDVLASTFPASDPPAWVPGIARPAPVAKRPATSGADDRTSEERRDVLDVSRPPDSGRTFRQAVRSLLGAAGMALLLPLVIAVIALPVALVVHGGVRVAGWLLALVGVTPA